jgi:hypothetical protein
LNENLLTAKATEETILKPAARGFFGELGESCHLYQCRRTYTSMTGSLMHKEVTDISVMEH